MEKKPLIKNTIKYISSVLILTITLAFNLYSNAATPAYSNQSTLKQYILPVQHGQLAYYRFGHGSPMVLITGYGATLSEWNNTFLYTLAKSHEIIVFDNRGVGNSIFSTNSYNIRDLSNDTAQLITKLHLNKPTIVGWSMGGMVAQELAIQNPTLIGKLVLMNTKMGGNSAIPTASDIEEKLTDKSGTHEEKFNRVMHILFPMTDVDDMSKDFVANMFKPGGKPEPSVIPSVLLKQKTLLKNWQTANDIPQKLRQLNVPTLILSGSEDVIIPPQNAVILADTIPGSQLVIIKNGGHAMMYQYPKIIAEDIDKS